MRKRILALLLCIVLLASAGCSAQPKDFSKEGLTITLTEDFKEQNDKSYTAYYLSDTVAVYALREEFELFEGGDVEVDLPYYMDLVIEANGLDSKPQEKNDLLYFVFEKEVKDNDFTYYAFVYEGSDAFWLVQFCCETKNAEKLEDTIFQYAKSVKV